MVSRRSFFTLFAGAVPAAALAKENPPEKRLIVSDNGATFEIFLDKKVNAWQMVGKRANGDADLHIGRARWDPRPL